MLFERWDIELPNENREEERKIVENVKNLVESRNYDTGYYIMLKDGRMVSINEYVDMVDKGEVSSNDAYVFVIIASTNDILFFLYPFLSDSSIILDAYLSKTGLYYYVNDYYDEEHLDYDIVYYSAPATSLRFITIYVQYGEYSAIEVADLDILAKNTKIKDIISSYVRSDTLDDDTYEEILEELQSQQLFADYDFDEAEDILDDYYDDDDIGDDDDATLEKEVARIVNAYNEVFKPYRVCFSMETQSQIDCSTIKL